MGTSGATAGIGVDTFTLFAVNAIILAAMSAAFYSAWRRQRHETYWLSWIGGNLAASAALVGFMLDSAGQGLLVAAGNCLLVVGFGLKWQAARQFSGRTCPWLLLIAPLVVIAPSFAFRPIIDPPLVFTMVNLVLAVQTAATAWEFWRDRRDGLPARTGLLLSYGLMSASFGARIVQGVSFGPELASYLPHDAMLQIHLLVAVVHTTTAGALALSIAYERSADRLRETALRDPLTGLHNRRAFETRLRDCLAAQRGAPFALVLFDLDRFKAINDEHGHAAGDQVLRACGEICQATLRPSDFVARIGGEEFAALLPGVSAEEAFAITERIRLAIESLELESENGRFGVTLSAGIFHGHAGPDDFNALMREADRSLYRAKDSGRNQVARTAA